MKRRLVLPPRVSLISHYTSFCIYATIGKMNLVFKLRMLDIKAKAGRTAGAYIGWSTCRDFSGEFRFAGGLVIRKISVMLPACKCLCAHEKV